MTNSDLIALSKEAGKSNLLRFQTRWKQLSNEQQSLIEELRNVCLRHGLILPVDRLIKSF